jgi:hypothetical protein
MPANDVDAADNPGVRKCLDALERLHAKFLSNKSAFADVKPGNLAALTLMERQRLQEELARDAETSDFDPLALSAMQEALRTAVRPGASGFEVSLDEIGKAMGRIDYLELWRHFFLHYAGNIFEWQVGAAGDDKTADQIERDVATLRGSVAPGFADGVVALLREERTRDVEAAVRCLAREMAG